MLSVRVGGQWLSSIAAYGPVTIEDGEHGSESASWQMSPTVQHPALRGNRLVQVYDGGLCVWLGTLIEPGATGDYSARGIWHQAESAPALNASGDVTAWPNDAIAQTFARGDISWQGSVAAADGEWVDANSGLDLAGLLNGYTAERATRWTVSPTGVVSASADPTTPSWLVPHAAMGRGLTPAEDEFATHLVGTYLVSAGVIATETVGSDETAAAFGRRSIPVDLRPLGFITPAKATSILTGMFLRAGARMGWAEGLELAHGQITTLGGIPAPLTQIRAGQMVRLAGIVDTSRANRLPAYTDIVIAKSRYTDGSGRIVLEPYGYAPRTLGDILDVSMVSL